MARKQYLRMLALAAVLVSAVSVVRADDLAAQEKMAERLCIKKQFAQAEQVYQGMLDQAGDPEKRFGAARKLAAVLTAQDDKQPAAKAAIAGILTDYARLPHAIHEIAENCHKFGKAKEAKGLYHQILEDQPERPDAIWLVMGQAIADTFAGDEDAAWVNTQKLLNDYLTDGRAAEAVGQVAWCCRKMENWENARALYQHVVDTWPDNERAIYSQRGIILASIELEDFDAAEAATNDLLANYATHPALVDAMGDVAEAYAANVRFEKSRDLHRYIIEAFPSSGQAIWSQRSAISCSCRLKDEDAIDEGLERLFTDFRDHPNIVKAMYQVARRLNGVRDVRAKKAFQFVLERDRDGKLGLLSQVNMGGITIRSGDLKGGTATFGAIIDKYKDHPNLIEPCP